MKRDLVNNLAVGKALAPAVQTGTDVSVNGDGIDLKTAIAAMLSVTMGPSGDTLSASLRADFRIEESDDNVTYTQVADADLLPSDGAVVVSGKTGVFASIDDNANDDVALKVGYRGTKRYIRLSIDLVGAHAVGFATGATYQLKEREMPQPLA